MTVDIEATFSECKIQSMLPYEVMEDLSDECSFYVDGYQYMPLVKKGRWDGRKKLFHKGYKTFPTGLLRRVARVLKSHDLELNVEWEEGWDQEVDRCNYPDVNEEFYPRPYQKDAVDTAIDARQCMIRIATGGGKTVVAGHIISRLQMNTIFLVHTKDLLYQAVDMFSEMLGEEYVGIIGDGAVDPARVTVCTIQTAARALGVDYEKYSYEEDDDWLDEDTNLAGVRGQVVERVLNSAGVLFMDETHRVAAPTAQGVVMNVNNAPFRFGLSASPWRDDNADLALEGAFGHVAVEVTASELQEKGYLVPPIIRFKKVPPQNFGKARYNTIYKEYIVENDTRTAMGVDEAVRMWNGGASVLLLVRWIKHGELVQEMFYERHGIDVPFIQGSDTMTRRNNLLDSVRAGDTRLFIATTIADEGLDMKPLSGLVLLGGGKSSVRALQRVGRVLRPWDGKNYAEVIDFRDQAKYLLEHSGAREKIYESEPAWVITDV